jgi:NAD(P)-dependent dehydrogenase (short-subunit alcohol dehydrogenase family)
MEIYSLEGKVAIVTGGGGRLGLAAARQLATHGAKVAIFGRTQKSLDATELELASEGLSVFPVSVDLAGEESAVRQAVDRTAAELGGVDVLVNNHALTDIRVMSRDIRLVDLDADLFAEVFRVNVIAYAIAAKMCIPHMIERGGGVVINVGSAAGHKSESVRPMYGTTKAAIIGLTRNIATHHARDRIRSVSVSLGPIWAESNTKRAAPSDVLKMLGVHTLNEDIANPVQVAALVAYLASDVAMLINGTDILADSGLLAHFPTWVEETAWADARQPVQ